MLFRQLMSLIAAGLVGTSLLAWGPGGARAAGPDLEPELVRLGELDALVLRGTPEAATVIYLHGFGGLGEDVFEALKEEIGRSPKLRELNWIFPDAPRSGWFNIEAIDPRTTEPLFDVWQRTLKPTRRALRRLLDKARLDPRKVIWGGFSQGAITAIDFVLHEEASWAGILVDSGIYFDSTDWNRRSRHLQGVPFFMTHDRRDSTLPFRLARKAEELLLSRGMLGKLKTNSLGHAISPRFLSSSLQAMLPRASCEESLR